MVKRPALTPAWADCFTDADLDAVVTFPENLIPCVHGCATPVCCISQSAVQVFDLSGKHTEVCSTGVLQLMQASAEQISRVSLPLSMPKEPHWSAMWPQHWAANFATFRHYVPCKQPTMGRLHVSCVHVVHAWN